MAGERNLQEEIVSQCIEHFEREKRYWNRLVKKNILLELTVIEAKEHLVEAIYKTASGAALKSGSQTVRENLLWDYKEVILNIKAHKERRTIHGRTKQQQ